MNYKNYFKEALVESLFIEMAQTPKRAAELDAEIERSGGKRRKDLMRRSIKEKESADWIGAGGRKIRARPSRILGDETAYPPRGREPEIMDHNNPNWNRPPETATGAKVAASRQRKESNKLRKELGMKEISISPAERATLANVNALDRGFFTRQEEEQEAKLGNKASLGKRIGRAIGRMTGSIRVPSDYDDEVEARTEKGRKKTELRDRY